MRTGSGFLLTLLVATGTYAQIPGVGSVVHPAGGAGTPGVIRTTGSVVNPAGGVARPVIPGTKGTPTGTYRYNGSYGYPVYIGGYYSVPYISQYGYGQTDPNAAAQPQQNITVVVPPPQPVTPVVINYNYGPPAPNPNADAANGQAPQADQDANEPAHYLIAMKDHTIYVTTAYWVDGDTLHYFTAGNVHNQASVSLVDRDFTERLNKEAGVDVDLRPSAK